MIKLASVAQTDLIVRNTIFEQVFTDFLRLFVHMTASESHREVANTCVEGTENQSCSPLKLNLI